MNDAEQVRRIAVLVEFLVLNGIDPRTIQIYSQVLKRVIRAGLDIDQPEVMAVAEYARSTPNTHASRSQLRSTLKWYWQATGIDGPATAVKVPPQPLMVCKTLEDDEARAVEKTALSWWPEGAACLIALYMALRRTEIAQAEWRRFDEGLRWYRVLGKGSKTAQLPVNALLRSELEHRRTDGYLFPGRFGDHVTPATINNWIDRVGVAAGVGHLPPHRLRHTSLATANDRTGDLRAVQTFARHAKPETTAGYTRTTEKRLRDVSDSLGWQ